MTKIRIVQSSVVDGILNKLDGICWKLLGSCEHVDTVQQIMNVVGCTPVQHQNILSCGPAILVKNNERVEL
jgi:hypothetical protein